MLVPFRYVRLLLQCALTPREAWVQLAGALFNENNTVSYQPLIDWLRVALVRQGDGQPFRLAKPLPNVPLAMPVFMEWRWVMVLRDLPSLGRVPALGTNIAIATHLGELVADMRQNCVDDKTRRATESARMPEKYYGMVGVAKLLRTC